MDRPAGRGSTGGVANAVLRSDVSCRRADRRCAGTVWNRRHRRSDRLGPVPHRSRLDRRAHDRWSPGAPVTASYFTVQNTATDPVFIRSACVRTRPNAPIPLTIDTVIRDREGAARIHSARYAAHAVSLSGGAMVRRAYRQRSLVEVLLPDGDKLWDPTLRQIDTLLDDDVLIDRVTEALAQRHPQSQRRGRLGTPATVVLRMLVLKHLSDW